jgi:hypothetical protein
MPISSGNGTQMPSIFKEFLAHFDAQNPQLEKAGNVFYFPKTNKNKKIIDSDTRARLSNTTDNLIEKLFTFIKSENLRTDSTNYSLEEKTSSHLFYKEKQWRLFEEKYLKENGFSSSVNRKIFSFDEDKFFANLNFKSTGSLSIRPGVPLKRTMIELLTDKEGAQKTSFSSEGFLNIINILNAKIDDLFIKHGYETTLENRDNLISLVWGIGPKLLKLQEIKVLLGTDKENHKFSNSNLIKLASQGYNSGLVNFFYFYDYYPSDLEDFKTLKMLPHDMFLGILRGNDS